MTETQSAEKTMSSLVIADATNKRHKHVLDAIRKMENGRWLLSAKLSDDRTLPKLALRDQIRQLVNRYSSAANIAQQEVWHKIYDQLYYLYHISIRQYKKDKRETFLDVADRNNFLDKIYAIISNMIREGGFTA